MDRVNLEPKISKLTPYRFDIRSLPEGLPISRELGAAVQEIFGTVRGRVKLWGYYQKGFPPEWLAERYRWEYNH